MTEIQTHQQRNQRQKRFIFTISKGFSILGVRRKSQERPLRRLQVKCFTFTKQPNHACAVNWYSEASLKSQCCLGSSQGSMKKNLFFFPVVFCSAGVGT